MRNPVLPGIVLFYSIVALIVAVLMVVFRERPLFGAGAQSFSNACENLALIVIALGVWVQRR